MSAWLLSARADLTWLTLPWVVGLLVALTAPAGAECPEWAWVVLVLGVDVAHVWASLYRVYLDPVERRRRPVLYTLLPVGVYGAGTLAYAASPAGFWTLLAYLAVYHFIKQQAGFVALYRHREGDRGAGSRRFDQLAVWVGTGFPVVWWHAHLPRRFSWFVEGDFITGLPPSWVEGMWAPYTLVGVTWLAWRLWELRQAPRLGRVLTMGGTWACWGVGIVLMDGDLAFTATNVLLHGVPYMALVWWASRPVEGLGGGPETSPLLRWITAPTHLWAFVGLLVGLALGEELLWDAFVWQERTWLFGDWTAHVPSEAWVQALFVPLLTVPQATHYLLDGVIWRLDGSNPGLRRRLLEPPPVSR